MEQLVSSYPGPKGPGQNKKKKKAAGPKPQAASRKRRAASFKLDK